MVGHSHVSYPFPILSLVHSGNMIQESFLSTVDGMFSQIDNNMEQAEG